MLEHARTRAVELGREIDLREGDAQALSFPDASFDTVVCTLGLCGFPDERAAIIEMHRSRCTGCCVPTGNCCCSITWFGQWLLVKLTVRMIGDYQTRRPLPLVEQAGFTEESSWRSGLWRQ